jgi:hypothetical protein
MRGGALIAFFAENAWTLWAGRQQGIFCKKCREWVLPLSAGSGLGRAGYQRRPSR